ncbi:MAG: hypothetical protein AAF434_01475 [Pseudomonadota bacterium]
MIQIGDLVTDPDIDQNNYGGWYRSAYDHGSQSPKSFYETGNQKSSNRPYLAAEAAAEIVNDTNPDAAWNSNTVWSSDFNEALLTQRYHNGGSRQVKVEAEVVINNPSARCNVRALAGRSEARDGSSGITNTNYKHNWNGIW